MKIATSGNKQVLRLSKKEWEAIGKKNGWDVTAASNPAADALSAARTLQTTLEYVGSTESIEALKGALANAIQDLDQMAWS